MLYLNKSALNDERWKASDVEIPEFDFDAMCDRTRENPKWLHFGAGNIFRAFPAAAQSRLLAEGKDDTGIIVAEGFDYDIIDHIYAPCDNLSILVTLCANGDTRMQLVASVAEALAMNRNRKQEFERLKQIFRSKSLQMVSFTITEKGYQLSDAEGHVFPQIEKDFSLGPASAESYMGMVTALCYERYQAGRLPLALVSMDNFSHNGDRLRKAVISMAERWCENGRAEEGFLAYLADERCITFPITMIDKITPRPDEQIARMLTARGIGNMTPEVTGKKTYIAPYVNAEACQYLMIEDKFPAGRPRLFGSGIVFTTRETVEKTERMKVCTCLNPIHTALAVFGCLLSYHKIADEMENPLLKKLTYILGYQEGLPVVTDPEILNPKDFLTEVLTERVTNPFLPDTPQRIATDTSQKLAVRFGETLKMYEERKDRTPESFIAIPLVIAGWCRYLLGVDDEGECFEISPDPMLDYLKERFQSVTPGVECDCDAVLDPLLSNENIFGVNLIAFGLGEKIKSLFAQMISGKGAVRATLEKYLGT